MIARRHVFHIGGYDPIDPKAQLERFHRTMSRVQRTWNIGCRITPLNGHAGAEGTATGGDGVGAFWDAESFGPNWTTQTRFEILRWDDLILADFERGMLSRLGQAAVTMADFIANGTLLRYIGSSWKYSGFFLFPYLYVAAFALAGVGLGWGLIGLAGWHGLGAVLVASAVALAVFWALLAWFGWRRPINHVFDDWIFSREFVYGQRPRMELRLDDFARRIVERCRQADVDEVILIGHCLGAGLLMDVMARALALDPDLARHGPRVCILTVGATIPKFSLHPRGEKVRQGTQVVAAETDIAWTEYHARDDAISFYRFDPVTLRRVGHDRTDGRPVIRRVQMHTMMAPDSFRRHRFNFMRIHYQFLMGNDQRAAYDYGMIACGPLPFEDITGADGAVHRFAADGSLRPAGPPAGVPRGRHATDASVAESAEASVDAA